ncbi:nuclear transport factor 2 family protein [Streptococcus ratti]|uniref:Nuclear transport factor 2 family protein n=1 Tax=Streptococcus ratti TaxID=1341 RepID=A0A7X9QHZ0_STRRT|nr:nuclear transport factor 2 family protein [Streptococcus ratti]NMD49705.1 nuclear transport factor 2 family protein [Streptococcus ratti]
MTNYNDEKMVRRTIDLYAHYADTRQSQKQADLFAEGAVFHVFAAGNEESPVQTFTQSEELLAVFDDLNRYRTTFHFNGQTMIDLAENSETATAETYTIAYHESDIEGKPSLMTVAIRYEDEFVKVEGEWKFKLRNLYIRFIDTNYDIHSEQI